MAEGGHTAADKDGFSLPDHVRQRLAQYRATPHCTTGESPSVLLHGRRMRLRLPIATVAPPRDSALQHRVEGQQQRNSRNYNTRQAVRPSDLKAGDTVRVRKQGHVPKNQSRFSDPLRVTRQLGPATYLLSDGSKRNAAHLARTPDVGANATTPPRADGLEPPAPRQPTPPPAPSTPRPDHSKAAPQPPSRATQTAPT